MKSKFRYWDMTTMMMRDLEYLQVAAMEDNPIMQWTGMVDCNGTCIYENDIVLIASDWTGDRQTKEHYGVVIFDAPEFRIQSDYHQPDNPWFHCRVVGNSYLNPELLIEDNTFTLRDQAIEFCSKLETHNIEYLQLALENERRLIAGEKSNFKGCPNHFGLPNALWLCRREGYPCDGESAENYVKTNYCDKCWRMALGEEE